MQPTFTVLPNFPDPCSDESDCFSKLIGAVEFQHGHHWVTNPIIEELAACLKENARHGSV
jgi:hypothetical protein